MVGRVRIELTESGTNGLQPPPAPYGFTCRYLVGVERFELSTFRAQTGRSAQTELRPDLLVYQMGFEPTSFCLQGRCFPIKLPAQIGAPDRTRTCTVRTLIPFPLPGLGYWSLWSGIRDSNPNLQFGRLICLAVTPMPLISGSSSEPVASFNGRHH